MKLSGLGAGRPRLTFTLAQRADKHALSSVSVTLPSGLSFARRAAALAKGVTVRSGSRRLKIRLALRGRALKITFLSAVKRATVTIASPAAVAITRAEAAKVRQHKVKVLTVKLAITDSANRTTTQSVKLKKPS